MNKNISAKIAILEQKIQQRKEERDLDDCPTNKGILNSMIATYKNQLKALQDIQNGTI